MCSHWWNLFLLFAGTHGSTFEDINYLLQNKSNVVNKRVRPVFNQSDAIEVYFKYQLMSIYNFDEVAQKITTVGYFELWWRDELMAWDPENYNDLKSIILSDSETWTPTLVLANPSGKSDAISAKQQVVRYYHTGWSYFSPIAVYESTCSVDVTYYPWDEQVCELYFTPWGYSQSEVSLIPSQRNIGTLFFTRNGAWDLIDSASLSYVNDVTSSVSILRMKLRRRPLFCVINNLLPVVFMSVMNTFVFTIPIKTGERFSFCITVLLSIAVFLTLIGDNLPKVSDPISLLSYYLVALLSNSVLIVLANIVSSRLYLTDEHVKVAQPWSLLVQLTHWPTKLRMRKKKLHGNDAICNTETTECHRKDQRLSISCNEDMLGRLTRPSHDISKESIADKSEMDGSSCEAEVAQSLESTASCSDRQEDGDREDRERRVTWSDVSEAFDRLCFLFFLSCLTAVTVLFVVSVS